MGLGRYIAKKTGWYVGTLAAAVILNFLLPRLVPGNPVDAIMAGIGQGGGVSAESMQKIYEGYAQQFGLDKPLIEQFFSYVANLAQGNLGLSFGRYPMPVNALIGQALPWTLAIQIPSIIIGWVIGNVLGALAAYKGGNWDRSVFTASLFASSIPYYCLSILLLYGLAVAAGVLPSAGAYSLGVYPEWSFGFFLDALSHWWLPFLSLVVVTIGGQAVGMRSMAIYELGADYVTYSRGLGVRNGKVVGYLFHNAMLPQITGLASSLGTMVGGALITELVFSYPGMGSLLFNAISQNDYPLIQGITLIITVAVLVANFIVEIVYGFVDPRIRSAQTGEK
jgi:peptide/nickel transport system permease protein